MSDAFRSKASTALYQAVKDHVREGIRTGAWAPGARIPSESELVERLGVSRMTVNRALRELAQEGLLRREAGVGSFVAERKAESGLLEVVNIADEIRSRGHRHDCRTLLRALEAATAETAALLGLVEGAPVFHVISLHREDGIPVQLEDRFINPNAAPGFLADPGGAELPGAYLLARVALDDVEHRVEAAAADAATAALLAMRAGDPCLVLTRRTWSGPMVVTTVRCVHPGSRYRFSTRFKGSRAQAVG